MLLEETLAVVLKARFFKDLCVSVNVKVTNCLILMETASPVDPMRSFLTVNVSVKLDTKRILAVCAPYLVHLDNLSSREDVLFVLLILFTRQKSMDAIVLQVIIRITMEFVNNLFLNQSTVHQVNTLIKLTDALHALDHARLAHQLPSVLHASLLDTLLMPQEHVLLTVVMD